jgi:hypothetical protein
MKIVLILLGILVLSAFTSAAIKLEVYPDNELYANVNTTVNADVDNSNANLNSNANINANSDNSGRANIGGSEVKIDDNGNGFIVEKIAVKTGLNISYINGSVGQNLRVYLSNGRFAEVRILPSTAAQTAIDAAQARCENNNCTVELKETGNSTNQSDVRAVYEVEVEKDAKVFGVFNSRMPLKVEVNAETGDVVRINRPWWSFMAVEYASNVGNNSVNISGDATVTVPTLSDRGNSSEDNFTPSNQPYLY